MEYEEITTQLIKQFAHHLHQHKNEACKSNFNPGSSCFILIVSMCIDYRCLWIPMDTH